MSSPTPKSSCVAGHLHDRESGRPEEIGASYIPVAIAGGTFLEEPSVVPKALFVCVEDLSGKRYDHAHHRGAIALDLPSGAAVLHVIHTARAEDGTVLEVSESVWPADRVLVIDDYPIEPYAEEPDAPSEV
jgi:GntR family transcriptional regulator